MDEQQSIAEIYRHLVERYPLYKTNAAFERWLLGKAGADYTAIDAYLDLLGAYGYIDGEGMLRGDYTTVPDPGRVLEDIRRRLDRLDSNTLKLLEIASVEGVRFSVGIVAALNDDAPESIAARLRDAAAVGVVMPEGAEPLYETFSERFRFLPNQARDLIYGQLADSERVRLHAALAELLSNHLERVTDPGAREMLMQMIDDHNNLAVRPDPSALSDAQKP